MNIYTGEKIIRVNKTRKSTFPIWLQFGKKTLSDIQEPIPFSLINYWTGKKGMESEKVFADWEGSNFFISGTHGTATLHIAISSLGIRPGDEVIVPSHSFIASSFAIVQAGAIPVFTDVTENHTLDSNRIEQLITSKTKGILIVLLYGIIAYMAPLLKIVKEHKLLVIEDCAQAIGGFYKNTCVELIGDIGCFSFCQSKHFTTREGVIITNNENLAWECRSFRGNGYDVKSRLNLLTLEEKLPYIHKRVGYNYRMTKIQIIGLNGLTRFDSWNMKRRLTYAAMYDKAFTNLKGIKKFPYNSEERRNAYWWYSILLDIEVDSFCNELLAMGIPCYGIQRPEAYEEKAYKELNRFGTVKFPFLSHEYGNPDTIDYIRITCPTAKKLRKETISLFLHQTWEHVHIEQCIEEVKTLYYITIRYMNLLFPLGTEQLLNLEELL